MSVVKIKAHEHSGTMTHKSEGRRQQKERFTVIAFDVEERVKYTRPL
jgi:hypothetical protein